MKAQHKARLHLAMPLKTKELLDDLQVRTGSASMTETIKRALALLNVVSQEQEKGGELFIHRSSGEQVPIHIL
jgi:hypothetical protein